MRPGAADRVAFARLLQPATLGDNVILCVYRERAVSRGALAPAIAQGQ